MNSPESASLEQLLASVHAKGERLAFEIGSFVVLQVAETLGASPAVVTAADVTVTADGEVLVRPAPIVPEPDALRSVSALLARVLVAAGPGLPPRFVRVVDRAESGTLSSLGELAAELESALVPLNRPASQRVLSRILREARRERPAQALAQQASYDQLDAELEALVAARESRPPVARPPVASAPVSTSAHAPERSPALVIDVEHGPLSDPPELTRRGRPGLWLVFFGLLIVALVAGVAILRPDVYARLTGESIPQPRVDPEVDRRHEAELDAHQARFGTLVLRIAKDRAQVFRFIGRGPALAEGVPVGLAHEFAAVDDGGACARSVIAPRATWERSPDGPRYELALQLASSDAGRTPALGASRMPQNVGTPRGETGTVRIVTTPPSAKVYQLVGFAPATQIQNLRTDVSQEFLVYHPEVGSERVILGPSDWRSDLDGRRVAELSVEFGR